MKLNPSAKSSADKSYRSKVYEKYKKNTLNRKSDHWDGSGRAGRIRIVNQATVQAFRSASKTTYKQQTWHCVVPVKHRRSWFIYSRGAGTIGHRRDMRVTRWGQTDRAIGRTKLEKLGSTERSEGETQNSQNRSCALDSSNKDLRWDLCFIVSSFWESQTVTEV